MNNSHSLYNYSNRYFFTKNTPDESTRYAEGYRDSHRQHKVNNDWVVVIERGLGGGLDDFKESICKKFKNLNVEL
jgi:hypothetical protein